MLFGFYIWSIVIFKVRCFVLLVRLDGITIQSFASSLFVGRFRMRFGSMLTQDL